MLLSFAARLIPPTAGTDDARRRAARSTWCIGEPRPWEPGPTMSNNFGFGGHNGTIIVAPAAS